MRRVISPPHIGILLSSASANYVPILTWYPVFRERPYAPLHKRHGYPLASAELSGQPGGGHAKGPEPKAGGVDCHVSHRQAGRIAHTTLGRRSGSAPLQNVSANEPRTAERKLGTYFRLGTDPRRLSKGVPGRWSQNFRWPVLVELGRGSAVGEQGVEFVDRLMWAS
jgi:hypothetical protein